MNRLIFCNTLYQLIVAIQIHFSFEGKTTLVLTNEIKNVNEISVRLRELGIFESISVVDVKTKKNSLVYVKECVLGNIPVELKSAIIDEFIGFNFDLPSHALYAALYRNNKNMRVNRMEEGLLSYNTSDTSCRAMTMAYKIRGFFGLENLKTSAKKFYCFLPNAYAGSLTPVAVPRITPNDEKLKSVFNHVFIKEKLEPYKEKYIFLSCIYDIEGGKPIGELDLALRVAEIVGKDNLVVKVHPRDDAGKYQGNGLKVDINSDIPWEVIQINQDFSDKVLITTLSSSIINLNPLLEKPSKAYYGYELCNIEGNALAKHYREILERYLHDQNLELRNINVLNQLEELIS